MALLQPIPLFGPVGPEMLVILLILVLLFGANRIPKLARSVGESMGEFQKGREEIEEELEELEEETVGEIKQEVSDVKENTVGETTTSKSTDKE